MSPKSRTTTTRPMAFFANLFARTLEKAVVAEDAATERANHYHAEYEQRTYGDGTPYSRVDIDRLIAQDSRWKEHVAEQQFQNRKAQMYGLAATVLEMRATREAVRELTATMQQVVNLLQQGSSD